MLLFKYFIIVKVLELLFFVRDMDVFVVAECFASVKNANNSSELHMCRGTCSACCSNAVQNLFCKVTVLFATENCRKKQVAVQRRGWGGKIVVDPEFSFGGTLTPLGGNANV